MLGGESAVLESRVIVAPPRRMELCAPGCGRCGNGYRFAKRNGKPIFMKVEKALRHRHFLDFLSRRFDLAFTSRSSRTLNCPSNFSGHINPNKPANCVGQ